MRIPILGPILAVLNPNRPVSPPILHKNGLQSVENSTINNSQAIIGYSGKSKIISASEKNTITRRSIARFDRVDNAQISQTHRRTDRHTE